MGRELQKKKNRSGIQKLRMKPKSKKARLVQHPIIAANWDKSQTLSQNYKRLGLTSKLNKTTGGVEKKAADLEEGNASPDNLKILGSKGPVQLEVSEAKIERDPKTGAILRVIDDGLKKKKPNPLNDPLNDLDSDDDEEQKSDEGFNQHASNIEGRQPSGTAKTDVVAQLEQAASRCAPKFKAKQSEGERAFIEELLQKYGEDYTKMARDTKINYMQRSEGDLKKRVKKWKQNGGTLA
ncbi:Hypothetical protein R9X50_00527900 [Acrodontium crateriforme]|uniref:Nucleolar protein 16 n=1 Tax=Acrodontium crateriforme TaxID=150365 RepID=A0AAQ3RBD9_9PEZI|nr:Hypothetical protein R9X50_00527900 [Acrodontium crateriforme]